MRVVLHCCCAPCSCAVIEQLLTRGFSPLLFFSNPNIAPEQEYTLRKQELIRYAHGRSLPFVEDTISPAAWHEWVRGLEHEPERAARCFHCFFLRLSQTATYAHEQNIPYFATTLSVSRWKRSEDISLAGTYVTQFIPHVAFLDINWKKGNTTQRMAEISRQEQFYRQQYCGCVYSMRPGIATKNQESAVP